MDGMSGGGVMLDVEYPVALVNAITMVLPAAKINNASGTRSLLKQIHLLLSICLGYSIARSRKLRFPLKRDTLSTSVPCW
jgi:hypothetical protein